MDGQQASNPRLSEDLSAFPRRSTLPGTRISTINDDRSIHQRDFTSVNDGLMSYIEIDHGYQMVSDPSLANRFEPSAAQALFVSVCRGCSDMA